jgi:hypothetical protein
LIFQALSFEAALLINAPYIGINFALVATIYPILMYSLYRSNAIYRMAQLRK